MKGITSVTCKTFPLPIITPIVTPSVHPIVSLNHSLDVLPCVRGQVQHPEVFVVVELLPVWRGKLTPEHPELTPTLGNYHRLRGEGREDPSWGDGVRGRVNKARFKRLDDRLN